MKYDVGLLRSAANRSDPLLPRISVLEFTINLTELVSAEAANSSLMLACRVAISSVATIRDGPENLDINSTCESITRRYSYLVRSVVGVASEIGFTPIFFWQPSVSASRKAPGEMESGMLERLPQFNALQAACTERIESGTLDTGDVPVRSLSGLFDDLTHDVFLDHYGHLTAEGDERVPEAIAAAIAGEVARRDSRPSGVGRVR